MYHNIVFTLTQRKWEKKKSFTFFFFSILISFNFSDPFASFMPPLPLGFSFFGFFFSFGSQLLWLVLV
jgi:hypothetical protein